MDKPKLTIQLGVLVSPFLKCNFTDEQGNNEVADNVRQFTIEVFSETMQKLDAAIAMYLEALGINYERLSPAETNEAVIQALSISKAKNNEMFNGIAKEDGTLIWDEDVVEQMKKGQRYDN